MRHIHLADDMKLRFPGRDENFDQGVEIGMIAVLMDMELRDFSRCISPANLDQARTLARKMGYHLIEGPAEEDLTQVTFRFGKARPQLKLVHSASACRSGFGPSAGSAGRT